MDPGSALLRSLSGMTRWFRRKSAAVDEQNDLIPHTDFDGREAKKNAASLRARR